MHVFCGCLCLLYFRGDGVVGDVGVGFAVSVFICFNVGFDVGDVGGHGICGVNHFGCCGE